jgi:hypothetical protein
LGFAHAWADRHYLENADAMSYLDIAEAYLRGDWVSAVNTYWGPSYSWLTALAFRILKPSPYWKFATLHIVNFVTYLLAFATFDCLLQQLIRSHRERQPELRSAGLVSLPSWCWLALGYPLCLWSLLYLIKVREESPDMLVAASVFLACCLVLKIRQHPGKWLLFILLGVTLGFGYLSKAVMLPLSIIFGIVALVLVGNVRKAVPRVLVMAIAFLVIAGPFIYAMSRSKGRITFGESGRLNYLWSINRIQLHWQGNSLGHGRPAHPTRKLFDKPEAYEFGEPIRASYPVWYDPTYWFEGSVPRFNFRGQLGSLANSVAAYYELFSWGVPYGLLVVVLTFYVVGRRQWLLLNDLRDQWPLIVPALAGMALYSVVSVQGRYVAPFMVILWLALFSAVRPPATRESQRLISATTIILTVAMVITIVGSSNRELRATVSYLIAGEDRQSHEQWVVAENLKTIGVTAPDRVAVIGDSGRSFWAYLAGLRIVAEVPIRSVGDFWAADDTTRQRVCEAFAGTGAKVIVTERPALGTDMTGWKQIGNTTHYYYLLTK